MSYDYECDAQIKGVCERGGDVPAIAGQFREATWLTEDFGARMQDAGFELHDAVTICPGCAHELLTDY